MISKPTDPLDSVLSAVATDSTTADRLSGLPRLLRDCLLAARGAANLRERVLAELAEIARNIMDLVAKWIDCPSDSDHVHALPSQLDHFAMVKDDGNPSGPADALRRQALPTVLPLGQRNDADHVEAWEEKERELRNFLLLTLAEHRAETACPPVHFRAPRRSQTGSFR